MEFIGHLPAEERDYVLHIIENTDLSLEDKVAALDGLSDIIIKEKCTKYLTLLVGFNIVHFQRIQIWRRVSAAGPSLKASWSRSGEVFPWNIR